MSDHQKRGSSDESTPPNTQHNRPDRNGEKGTQDNESIVSRIQSSASGLARNAFFSSARSGDTAHLLSDSSGKAAPSSSSSALAAAEQHGQSIDPSSSSSSSRNKAVHGSAETFRSQPTAQSGGFALPGLAEDEFQNTYGGDLSETIDYPDKDKGKGRRIDPDTTESRTGKTAIPALTPSDGDAVVSILNDRTFDPEFPPSANEPPEYPETDLSQFSPDLTPDEIQMIESFRRQLPAESQSTRTPHTDIPAKPGLNSFSLVPDIDSFLDTVHATPAADPSTSHATSLRDEVLTSLPGAAEWISVEDKYHNEVWGFLQPTLEEAAREIESKKEGGSSSTEDGPAVRRLKMILKHMQH
ncbi:uncharacterized protein BDV17DRAFT_183403 [Aspergillus undulatus]|uniref:uncharacterized protein n=1 Tax=Aspergillus undulatus TaxID=1810928 RepID=UPI003CCD0E60